LIDRTGLVVTLVVAIVVTITVFAISVAGITDLFAGDADVRITSGSEELKPSFSVNLDNPIQWTCLANQRLEYDVFDEQYVCINKIVNASFTTKELPEGVYSKCWTIDELHLIPEGEMWCGEFKAYDEEREFYYDMVDQLMLKKIEEILGE